MTDTPQQTQMRKQLHWLVDTGQDHIVKPEHYCRTYPESDGITEEWIQSEIEARKADLATRIPPNNDAIFVEGVAK